jgi:hypothetical protein
MKKSNIIPNSRTFREDSEKIPRTFRPTNTDLILEHNVGKKNMIENINCYHYADKLYLDLFSVFLQL